MTHRPKKKFTYENCSRLRQVESNMGCKCSDWKSCHSNESNDCTQRDHSKNVICCYRTKTIFSSRHECECLTLCAVFVITKTFLFDSSSSLCFLMDFCCCCLQMHLYARLCICADYWGVCECSFLVASNLKTWCTNNVVLLGFLHIEHIGSLLHMGYCIYFWVHRNPHVQHQQKKKIFLFTVIPNQ